MAKTDPSDLCGEGQMDIVLDCHSRQHIVSPVPRNFYHNTAFQKHGLEEAKPHTNLVLNRWATKARFKLGEPSKMSFDVIYFRVPIRAAWAKIACALSAGSEIDNGSKVQTSGASLFSRTAYAVPSCEFAQTTNTRKEPQGMQFTSAQCVRKKSHGEQGDLQTYWEA